MNIKGLLKTRFLRNTSWILFSRVYQILINLVVSVASVRYLGPADYGLIHYAASFSALLTAVCTLGIPDVMVHELVRRPEHRGKLLGTAIVFRFVSGVLSGVTVCLLVLALNPGEMRTFWVTALYSGGLMFQSLETVQYYYQQKLMSRVTGLVTAAVSMAVALYKILLLVWQKDVFWFAAANVLDHGLFGLLLLAAYLRRGGQPLGFDWDMGRELLGRSRHFILAGLMVSLYGQMDKIMLKYLMDEVQVGYYSVAVTLNNFWPFVIGAVIESARPLILDLYASDRKLHEKRLSQLYGAVLLLGGVGSLAVTLLAEPLVGIICGEAYLDAVPALRIVTWSTAFSYLGVARSIWAVPRGFQRWEKYLAAIGVLSNGVLNYLMIPVWGPAGAAAATVLTQFITNFLSGLLLRPLKENTRLILKGLVFWEK